MMTMVSNDHDASEALGDFSRMPQTPAEGRIAGRTAIVTGGGSPADSVSGVGIGAAIARVLARDGAKVVIADINPVAADRTAAAIDRDGGTAITIQADVTSESDCRRVVDTAYAELGRIDVLVNNLGIDLAHSDPVSQGRIEEMTEDAWERVMSVNVKSMMLMAKHVVSKFEHGGSIVNISSISSFRPMHTRAEYSVSKAAVNGMTLALAVQLAGRRIRVNGVCPGSAWTAMSARPFEGASADEVEALRRRRLEIPLLPVEGTAWHIAEAAAFLASDQASWITGQLLVVDGGATLYPHWSYLDRGFER
jgi:NAD(P)-dependent dehydrogenase (short-subunit alcohol dehydrogenase family)